MPTRRTEPAVVEPVETVKQENKILPLPSFIKPPKD